MKRLRVLFFSLIVLLLTACSEGTVDTETVPELENGQIYAFFVNTTKTDVYPVVYTLEGESTSEVVQNIIHYM